MITEGRLTPVNQVLSQFLTKLSDAQNFLQKAAITIQEMEGTNKANILKSQRYEVSVLRGSVLPLLPVIQIVDLIHQVFLRNLKSTQF